jgi:hypothetical protein
VRLAEGDDLEAPFFDALQDGARPALFDGIGLYDAKGSFKGHEVEFLRGGAA